MKIYALSDIHGYYDILLKTMDSISLDKNDTLIFLGDYIDRGKKSYQVLKYLYDLQKSSHENIIVLKGNHELYLEEWIKDDVEWLTRIDYDLITARSFFAEDEFKQMDEIFRYADGIEINKTIKEALMNKHEKLLKWMFNLPYYYETEKQIYVHAGIDEKAKENWKIVSPDYMYVEKMIPSFGKFYKDIIAGHLYTSIIAEDDNFHEVFYDGFNHYYIDGKTYESHIIPILVYDSETYNYYQIIDGIRKQISVKDKNVL